jgi:DNA-binding LacI/PurR family transcriptional regulator
MRDMTPFRVMTAQEQVVQHLRGGILRGDWVGVMPGGDRLATELGVGKDTIERALHQLEHEGFLIPQGRRRGRKIQLPENVLAERKVRIGILVHTRDDLQLGYLIKVRNELEQAGQRVVVAPRTISDLKMDEARVARMVEKTAADAWIVVNGAREVLEWFATGDRPTFALFGRRYGLPIAGIGPDKGAAVVEVTRELIGLGHRRILYLARPWRRLPGSGAPEQLFLDELEAHGISPSPYHLPDWEESVDGFHARLTATFRVTPPTALIVDETPLFVAVQHFLARNKLRVPDDVSLVCANFDPLYDWCRPRVARIRWDQDLVVKRVTAWVAKVAAGKPDTRQSLIPANFLTGETIGPCLKK